MARRRHAAPAFSLFSFQDIITSVTGIVLLVILVLTLELLQRHFTSPPIQAKNVTVQIRSSLEEARNEIKQVRGHIKAAATATSMAADLSPTQARKNLSEMRRQAEYLRQQIEQSRKRERSMLKQHENWVRKSEDQKNARVQLESDRRELSNLKNRLKELADSNRIIYNPSNETGKIAWIVDITASRISVSAIGQNGDSRRFASRSNSVRLRMFTDWAKGLDASRNYFVLILRPGALDTFRDLRRRIEGLGFDLGFDLVGRDVEIMDVDSGRTF